VKKFVIVALAFVLLLMLLVSPGLADSGKKNIEATFNNIQLVIDGTKIVPKDANGNIVEPFIYNGSTYLPVRAVGEAIGKTVEWDPATQTVYLGEKPITATEAVTQEPVFTETKIDTEPVPTGNSLMVWIPKTGAKYHRTATCSNMKNPSSVTETEAIKRGYTKCSKCW
jgi:hypothetical protein